MNNYSTTLLYSTLAAVVIQRHGAVRLECDRITIITNLSLFFLLLSYQVSTVSMTISSTVVSSTIPLAYDKVNVVR
jgi:hypothetical protein